MAYLPFLIRVAEMREIRCKRITIEKDGMVRVNGPNGRVDLVVKVYNTSMFLVRELIERIVACDPWI